MMPTLRGVCAHRVHGGQCGARTAFTLTVEVLDKPDATSMDYCRTHAFGARQAVLEAARTASRAHMVTATLLPIRSRGAS